MAQTPEDAVIDKDYRICFTIWIALVISLFLYTFVGLSVGETDPEASMTELLILILAALSVVLIGVGFSLRNQILRAGFPIGQSMSPPARYRTAMIIALAIFESIGLYGLVIYLVFGNRPVFFAFMAIAIIMQVLVRPDRAGLAAYVAQNDEPS